MQLETRISIEKKVGRLIAKNAVELGYTVSVFDGEEYAVKRSSDVNEIVDSLMSTDEDVMVFRKNGERVGSVFLVYGNDGWDVITDYTDTEEVRKILEPAEKYAGEMEEKYG